MKTKQLFAWAGEWKKAVHIFIGGLMLLGGGQAVAQTWWYGTVSTAWNNPTNWTPSWEIPGSIQSVPASGASILIPSGCPFYPVVTNSLTIGSLTMNQGSGSLTVSNGTLAAGAIDVAVGGSITINSNATLTSSGAVTAGGTWTVSGSLICSNSMALNSSSVISINSGATLNTSSEGIGVNSGGGTLNIYGTLNNGAIAMDDDANISILGGTLTAGTITLNAVTLTVSNATLNASGFILYNGGELTVNGASTVTSTGAWTYDGGGWSITSGNFYFSGGTETLPNGTFTSLNLSGGGTYSLASGTAISGNLNLASGTVAGVASGLNISAGTLMLGGAGELNGTWGSTSSSATHTNNTYFSGAGVVSVATNTATGAAQIKANNNTALQSGGSWVSGTAPGATDNAVWNSTVSTAANCTNSLGAAVTWNGIAITNPAAPVMINGNTNLTLNNGINMVSATKGLTLNCGTISVASNQTWTVAAGLLLTTGSATNAGSVNGSNNIVTLAGGGTWVASGTGDNNSLGVTVSAGTLELNKTNSSAAHAVGGPGLTVNSGATAQLTGTGGDQIYNAADVTVNGTLDLHGNSETINGLNGSGTVTSSLTNGTPTLTVGGGATEGAAADGGTFTGTIEAEAGGSITLTTSGTNVQSVACITRGNGTNGPFINVNAGTLILNGSNDNAYAEATVSSNATLLLNKTSTNTVHAIGSSGLTINSGGLAQLTGTGGDQINNGADVTVNGTLDLNGNSETINGLNGSGTITTTLANGTPTLTVGGGATVGGTADGGTFTGTIEAGANGSITLTTIGTNVQSVALITRGNGTAGPNINVNAGTLILNGSSDNNYVEATVASNATLLLDKTSASLVHAIGSGGLTVNSGGLARITGPGGYQIYYRANLAINGTFDLNGDSEAISDLSGSGTVINTLSNSVSTLTVTFTGDDSTFNGTIANGTNGTISLVKAGTGTFTLAGANTYTGNTIISTGTLAVASGGSLSSASSVSIAAGATFDVSGLSSPYVWGGSASLTASGTASAATLNGASGGIINMASQPIILNYNGSNPALTVSQGTLALNGNAFTINGPALAVGTYTVITQASGSITLSGSCPVSGTVIGSGQTGAVSVSGGSVILTIQNATTTTLVRTAGSNPSTYGGAVTFQATVSPTPANGETVTFKDGSTTIGTAATASGVATLAISTLGAGTHSITAVYPGDTTNTASTSSAVSQTVDAATVTITSGITANPKVYNATTTATISSNNVVLSGVVAGDTNNVHLSTNGYTATFASAGVSNGVAVTVGGLTLTGSAVGNYTLTQPAGLTASITAAAVTVTSGITVSNKVYNGTTTATLSSNSVVLSGVVAGDTNNVHLSTNGCTAAFASASVGTGVAVTVGGLTLTGSAEGNYTLTPPAGLTANITAAAVTVTSGITANNQVYNGTTTATISSNNVVLGGVVAGDTNNVHLSTNSYTAAFATASVGTGVAVTVGGLALTGSAAGNYTLAQPAGLTANITAAAVTITSGLTVNNQVYNGTTTATFSSNSVVLSGVLAGDAANVHLSTNGYTATFASAGVSNGVAVTVGGLTLTGSAAGNYTLAQPAGLTANITPATVTITSGVTVNNKVYNGTTTATINSNSVVLGGVVAGDTANVHLSTNGYAATFASAGVGTGVAVTVGGLTLTGSAAGNYTLTQPAGLTANITASAVTITSGITANNKIYNGTTAATISSNSVVLGGVVAGDTANVALSTNGYTAIFASSGVANGVAVTVGGLTLTGSAAGNYTLTQPAGLTANITAAAVTITSGITANNKVYNGTTTATINSNSVVLGGVVAGDTANVHLSTNGYTAAFATASVGTGVAVTVGGLTLTGNAAGNYTLTPPTGLTASITASAVTITSGITANSQVYNGTATATISSNNVVLSGVVAGDTANVHLSTNSYTATFATASVGTGVAVTVGGLTLTGSAAGNYTLAQPAGLTANITAAAVTITSGITANNKTYNGTTTATINSNSVVLGGVVAGDTANVALSTNGYTAIFASAGVSNGVAVTVGGLTLAGSAAGNYTLTQPAGLTANITAAAVTITSGITANNKVYNGTTTATINSNSVVLSGVAAGDTANVHLSTNGYAATFASAGVGTGVAVTVGGLTLTGSAAGNYTLTQPAGLTANITASAVTITSGITANNQVYNGTMTATISSNNVVLGGVVAGDTANVALSTNGYTATFASAGVSNGVAVTVGGLTLAGSAAGNYTLTQPAGLTANITAAAVTITSGITANNKVYNGTTTATINSNSVVLSGVVAGDTANVHLSTNGYTAAFASAGVGTGVAVTVGGLTLTGSAAGNYTLTQPAGLTANITASAVTITSGITANSQVYNGTTTATISSNNVVLGGVVAGDTANVALSTNGYTATFASADVSNGVAVTVGGLILTGSAAGNYTLAQPAGLTANITAATVTITSGVTVNNKVYNGTTTATISSNSVVLGGVVAGDTNNVHLSTNGYTATFASAGVSNGVAVTVSGLTLVGSAAGNYTLAQPAGLTANITAAAVTVTSGITANNQVYNGTAMATISSNNVVLSGVVAGDTANVHLSTNSYTATFATASVGIGVAVTVGGLTLTGSAAGNYTLTQPAGLTANITAAAVTITSGITANNKTYNGTTTATINSNSVVLGGVVAGDTANVALSTNGYTAIFASAGVSNGVAVTVGGLTLTGSAAGNYTLAQPAGLTANITPATVTITSGVTVNNKVYNGTTTTTINSNSVVLGGVVAGDTANVHLSTNGYAATFASAGVGTGVAVTVGGLTLTGSAAGNYTLTQPAGLTANITASAVTITSGITANNQVYNGTTTATISSNNVVLGGVVAGDTANVALSTNGYTATFASSGVANGVAVTVGGLTLTGSAAGNYTLAQPAGLTANITAAAVTITSGVTVNNKVYNGTTTATLSSNSVVLSGVVAGDTANVHLSTNGYTAAFATASVGTGVAVTVGGLTLTGSAAGNYTLAQPAGLTANITAAAVTVTSGITANNQVYNGTTMATISSNNVVLSGVVAGDTANVHLSTNSYTATFATASVGTGVAVTVGGLTLTGSAAGNYTLAQPAGLTANITAAAVTITSGITANNKTYNGTTTATINSNSVVLGGVVAGDTANVALSTNGYTAIFASAGVSNGVAVTVGGLTLAGSAAGNYTLAQPAGLTANITPATVTITSGVTVNNKVYNGTTTATLSSNSVVLSGVVAGDTANVHLATNGYAATFASAGVGTGVAVTVGGLTLTGSAAGNYTLTQPAGLTANITASAVTITSGITANSQVYNGTTTATISSNNVVLGGVVAADTANVALSTNGYTATFASAGVSNGVAVTVGGLMLTGSAAGNYTLAQPAGLTANITAATVTITSGVTVNNKVYNGTTTATISSNSVVLGGVVAGDTANVALSTNGYTAIFASAGVSNGVAVTVGGLTLAGSAAGNYTLAQPAGLTANITPATVTITSGVTVNNKVYNGTTTVTLSSNSVVLSGVVAGDTANVHLSTNGYTAAFATASVGTGVAVTVGGLTLTGSAAGNYTLTQPAGLTANITASAVTITSGITANNQVYNGTTTATISSNNVVLGGVVAGDTANVALSTNGYTATFASSGVANGVAVTVGGLTLTGSAAGNYTLAQPAGLTANITAAAVTITSGVTVNNKVYNGTTTATLSSNSVVLSGVVAGDTANVHLSTNGYTAAFATASVGTGVAVTVGGLTLTGSAAGNYTLTQPAGLTANITASAVTITSGVTVNNKVYNGTTTATISSNSVVLGGVVAGDTNNVHLSTNGYTATFASAGVSNGVAVTVGGLTLTGSAAGNYTLTQPAGLTANITAAAVTVTSGITANNQVYNGTAMATISSNNVVLSGVVAGDTANVHLSTNSYTATFATASVGTGVAVTVGGLTLTGSAAGNYTLTQPAGLTANITAAAVTVASGITANNKTYSGTTTATINSNSVVLGGVVAGDTANVALSTNGYTATFASSGVANGVAVTVGGLTLTGSAAGNYTLAQPAGLTANITPATVTITSGVTVNNKVYNGTTTATLSSNIVVLSGVAAGDTANVHLSTNGYTATFASAGVGTGVAVTVGGLTLTGSAAGNYTLTPPTGLTASITASTVTITSGITANSQVYNGTTTATISSNNVVLGGVVAGDTANVALSTNGYTATFASAGVSNGVAVTVGGLTLTGSAAGNYTLTQPAGLTANITAAAVTITSGVTVNNKVYNGTTTATISSNSVVLGGVVAGDTNNVHLSTNGYTATFASAGVSNGVAVTVGGLTLTGSAAGNYTLTQPAGLTANITAAAVTVTSGITANNQVYNGTAMATINSNNVVLSGVVAGDTNNVHLSTNGYTAAFATASVGTGVAVTVGGLTLTGSAAGNYTLTQPAGLTANITAAAVTVASGITANNKTYSGTTTATINSNSVVLGGVVAGDTANVALSTNGYTATFASSGVANGVAVTVGGLTLTGSAAGNYTLAQPAGLTANITPATVTITSGVTVNNKVYNGTTTATLSSNIVVLSGVAAGDTANVHLSTNGYTATFASAGVGTGVAVTVGGLTLTGSAAGNYTLTPPTGLTASITASTVTITSGITANSQVYNGTTTATISSNNVVLGGVVAGDTANVALSTNGYTATFASAGVSNGVAVTVGGLTLTGSAAGNYTLTQPAGLTANITAAAVTITSGVTVNNKVYNGTTTATISSNSVVLGGVVAGDTNNVHLSTNGYTATFASAGVSNGVAVTVGGLTLTGSAAGNYTLTQPAGLTANITAAAVTVTSGITANNQVYNGTAMATINSNNVVLSGVVAGDTNNVHLSTNGYTAAFATASVGTGVAVTVGGLTLTGSAAGNYTLAQPAGLTANITPATVTITSGITANNKIYSGTTTATINSNSVVLGGVVAGDANNVVLSTNGYTAVFASSGVANGVAVTVGGLTLTGSAAGNYTLAQPAGLTANITPATVTITSGVTVNNKVYNGTTTATLSSNSVVLSGVVAGDTANVHLSTNGYAATFASAGVGTGVAVTVGGLTLTGSAAGNYTLTQPAGLTANITVSAVTITSGITANNQVYNGTMTATISSNNVVLGGVVAGDTANVALSTNGYTATFASAGVSNGVAVTVGGLTLTGSAAGNYTLAQPSGLTANITAVAVTITSGVTANNKVYSGTTTATISSNNVVLGGVLAGDTANVHLSTNGYTAAFASAGMANGTAVTVGGLTLTGSAAGNYTLTPPAGLTANITAAAVTITSGITANNQVYNGTTTATISSNNAVLNGVVAGDTGNVHLSTNGYTAAFASASVGTGVAVTVGGLTLTGSAAGNYTLTQPAGLTANITAAAVTITSGITANNKIYNGTTLATLSSNSVVLGGVVAGDTANVALSTNGYAATFASAGVSNGVAVTVGGLTLAGSAAGNYTLTQPAGLTANITPATVTITSGITVNNKVYNGTTTATINSNSVVLGGVVAGDTANVHLSTNGYAATFASASVGTGVAVTVGGLTLTGSAAGNYTLTQPAGLTANITASAVTITSGITANNKPYDGTTTATVSSNNVILSGVLAGDTNNVQVSTNTCTATFATAGAGSGVAVTVDGLTLTGSAAGNYTLAQPSGLTANITAVAVTITSGVTANNKVYSGTTTATISSNNVVLGGVLAGDTANVHLSTNGYTAAFASAGMANGTAVTVGGLTLTGSAAGNYTLTPPAGLTANITAAAVTITSGITANNQVYNGTTTATISSNNAVLNGVVAGDTGNVHLSTNGYTAAFASASVGTGVAVTVGGLTLTGSAAGNYTLTQPAGLTANITAAAVTITSGITANNKTYNGTATATISSNNAVLNGVVLADTASVALSTNGYTAIFASAGVSNGVAVTVGGLTLAGSAAGNYTLTQPAGLTANITAAAVTITSGVTVNNKVYNGTTTATLSSNSVVLSGVVAGDTANVHLSTNGYTAAFATASVGTGVAVTVGGLTLTGSAAGNYTLAQPADLTATITASAVTITSGITANSKPYDGTTTATISSNNVVLSGVLAGDTNNVQVSTNGYAATFSTAGAGSGVAVTVDGLTLTGSAAGNYTLAQPSGLTANITAVAVTITSGVTANNKVYSGTTTATISSNNVVLGGVLAGDTANVHLSTNGYTAAFASAGMANGTAVTVGGLTLTGSAAGNYTLTPPAGLTANITAAAVTITSGITANNQVYNGTTTATISSNNAVLNGVVAGDTGNVHLSTNGYTAAFATASVGTGVAVTVGGLMLTGSAAGNYTLTQPAGLTANITAAAVTITSGITANNKTYNGTTTATISSNNAVLNGVVLADTASVALSTNGYTAAFASAGAANGIAVTVGGLTLTGSAAGNYSLTQPAGLTANITPVALTITSGITANNKVYSGTTAATISSNSVVLSGVVAGDTASVHVSTNGYTAVFAGAGVGSGIGVTVSGLTLTGGAATNYTLIQPAGLTASITAAVVTITSGITANNKPYDGTTTATISSNNVVLSGVVAGDTASMHVSTNGYTAAFASAGAGNGIAVTVGGLTLTGSAADNYTLTQPSGLTAKITQTTLVITSPTNGEQLVTNSLTVAVTGTTGGNAVVASVWLSLNGAAWTNATTANNWTNWSAELPVSAGAATLEVYAVDNQGNYSPTNTVAFTIIHTGLLTVLTNGNGTVSPDDNGATLEIGTAYTLTAAGLKGWAFANWTSNLLPTNNTASLNFTMASNLVLTANFTYTNLPTLTVTTPTGGQVLVTNSGTVTASGTAAASVPLVGVWLSLDGTNWMTAVTTNGWTNWSLALPVPAGSQLLRAYAVDSAGYYSLTNTVAFTIIHTGLLTVATNGSGTISPNDNGQTLEIGQKYSMTATASKNWRFTNWTSNLLPPTNTADLNFTMASNLALTANFIYTNLPTLTVTTLTNGEQVVTNSETVTVKGSAAANVPLAGVWLGVGGASWTAATSTNGWTNWSGVVPVAAGGQVLQAYAVDSYGNHSLTNTINFTIIHTGVMTVLTNGNGTVWPNYNTTKLQIGGVYSMLATGRNGWTFTNWTSNMLPANNPVLTNNDNVIFQMVSNLVLTANYVDLSQPTVTIPLLPAGQHSITNQNPLVINGLTTEAPDSSPITGVWVSFNSNAWQSVTTTNNYTNWSAVMNPSPGAQSVRAYALDAVGNYSPTNTVNFTFVQTFQLVVGTNQTGTGLGTISPNYNGQYLLPGTTYIMKAQALAGCKFLDWTSNLLPPTNTSTLFFTMVSNLMFYANFLDVTPPTNSVSSPVNGAVVTNSSITLHGTAADNVAVGQVWCDVNSNAWQLAAGTTNWSASASLLPGTNYIQVYALDTGNNASLTNKIEVTYASPGVLTLRTNGLGGIANAGGSFLVGQTYTLTAVPAAGFSFTNWTSNQGPGTNKAAIKFTMANNLVLTANFMDAQIPTVVITTPLSERETNSLVSITGTASDNWGVGAVYCQLNGGAWLPASTSSGYTNWTWSATLAPGTNVISAQAVDLGITNGPDLARYSRTSSVTVFFLTAPYNLVNLRALVTPDDGSPAFEWDFGSGVFGQYAWGTNNYNAAGDYQYANPALATGILDLQSFALPQNTFAQTLHLNFTNRYIASFSYTNGEGRMAGASAVFTPVTNISPATLKGQTLVTVNALGGVQTCSFPTTNQAVQTTGALRQTNAWSLQNYGPCAALLVLTGDGQTNWSLFHFETAYAAEYFTQDSDGKMDGGLAGFVRSTPGGNAPQTGSLDGDEILDNSGWTLTAIALSAGQFALSTSDDSLTGTGTYNYSQVNSNGGQFILNYSGGIEPASVTNTILFYNPNFGVATNAASVSGLILR